MKKITRIAPESLSKVFGILYSILGLIGGAIISFISVVAALSGELNGWFGIAAIAFLPILYGVMGLVFGYVTAFLYNYAAKKVGGIELDIE